MLDAPETGPDAIAAPRERLAIHQPLKNAIKVGHVTLGALVTPSLRAEQTDVHEVVAGATAELEPPHHSALRRWTAAPLADLGKDTLERRVLRDPARVALLDCCMQRLELVPTCQVRSQTFASKIIQRAAFRLRGGTQAIRGFVGNVDRRH
jgi:hypothetical protein